MNEAEPFNMNEMTVAEIVLGPSVLSKVYYKKNSLVLDLVCCSYSHTHTDTHGAKVVAKCVHTGR